MAETKKKVKVIEDFRAMDEKGLQAKLAELRASLTENHRANAANELPSTAVIGKIRKEIAKALTVLTEKRAAAPKKEQEK